MPDPQFLTPKEIARALRVSEMTVSRLIRHGDIEAYKIGGQHRVSIPALKQYLTDASTAGQSSGVITFQIKESEKESKGVYIQIERDGKVA